MAQETIKRDTALKQNLEDFSLGIDHVLILTKPRLKDILVYKKEGIVNEIKSRFPTAEATATSVKRLNSDRRTDAKRLTYFRPLT